jgi:hypothetical protein
MTAKRAAAVAKKRLLLNDVSINFTARSLYGARDESTSMVRPEADPSCPRLLIFNMEHRYARVLFNLTLQDYKYQAPGPDLHSGMLEMPPTTSVDNERWSLSRVLKRTSVLSVSLNNFAERSFALSFSQVFPHDLFHSLKTLLLFDMRLSDTQVSDFVVLFLKPVATLSRLDLRSVYLDDIGSWNNLFMGLINSPISVWVWQARVLDAHRCVCLLDCVSGQPQKKCPRNWEAWKIKALEEEQMVLIALTPEWIWRMHYHDEAYWED